MIRESSAIQFGYKARPIEKHVEEELVSRACTGDGDAFSQLYERLADRIYRYVYFRVTDENTAEDLTSKVFLKAWEHLPSFKHSNSPFVAWLYTIAHNMVIDYYRTNKPMAPLDDALALPSSSPTPDQECDRRLEAQSLRKALQQLTPTQRDVVTLKLLDGLSTDEVAARMNKSEGAVRALQMRALQNLAGILKP